MNSQIQEAEIFKDIKCIVCQNSDKTKFRIRFQRSDSTIVQCENCGFHFIPPYFRSTVDYTEYKSQDVAAQVKQADMWIKIQRNLLRYQLIHRFKKQGAVYDVGVGFGHFILTGKELGHEVYGVELSRANAEFVKNELKLEIEQGSFLDVGEDIKYDIVTMWDVLEHIDAADEFLKKASRIMPTGGFLFIQVPQWESFFAALLKDKWWAMGLDHVNYFSKKTIKQLLEAHGFKVRKIKSSIELKNIYNYVIMPKIKRKNKNTKPITASERQQAFNKLTKKPRWLLWLLVKAHNIVYKTASMLHIGDEMLVVAEKYK